MRAVYKNPKELATCLKDLVDQYLDFIISYEKLKEKIIKIVEANGESVYKGGNMTAKLANFLGEERVKIINEIVKNNK